MLQLENGEWRVGGLSATALAEEFGAPLYVYHAEGILANYRRLTAAFEGYPMRIRYACKANTNPAILALLGGAGAGIDAVSIQEARIALATGIPAQEVFYSPNCVDMDEIDEAVQLGIRINIDSISLLEHFGNKYGSSVAVSVRLNPHIYAGGHSKIQVGHIDSKFGISIHQLRHVLRVVRAYQMQVEGLHMHTGSDILDAEVFLNGAEVLLNAALEFEGLQYLDFGSGFKVAYREGDPSTDIEGLAASLKARMTAFTAEYGREVEIWFEPGKFLVSEAGTFLTRVSVVKQTTSTVFAGVNSGFNHLIRPMMYDAYHHITNISNPEGPNRIYTVVGYICETDTLGYDRKLNEVREGDILAFRNAGAYGFSMASNYNSRLRPAEVLVYNGQAHLIRRRESFDDLLSHAVPVPGLSAAVRS